MDTRAACLRESLLSHGQDAERDDATESVPWGLLVRSRQVNCGCHVYRLAAGGNVR